MFNKRHADHYQYLFIGGLMGELVSLPWIGQYFRSNIKALRELGVQHIDVYQPHSFKAPEKNAIAIHQRLMHLSKNNMPLIVFAHSKGCLEILWAMAKHYRMYEDILEEAILVQPPLRGCTIIDRPELKPITKDLSKFWPGLHSLREGRAGNKLKNYIEECSARKDFIEKHAQLIKTTKAHPQHTSWPLNLTHKHLYRRGIETDGFLSLEDQSWDNFSWKETILSLDHGDLFTNNRFSKLSNDERNQVLLNIISN